MTEKSFVNYAFVGEDKLHQFFFIVTHKQQLKSPNLVCTMEKRDILIRHGAVKQMFELSVNSLEYVRSQRSLADPMTKGLTRKIIIETSRGGSKAN